MSAKVLILHATGTNRDAEAARACEMAGGEPSIVHINQLRQGSFRLSEFGMLVLPGGFSYGDALGAGMRQALDLRVFFRDELASFIDTGRPVLGICNGFQTLVKAGLLPWPSPAGAENAGSSSPTRQRKVTLTYNARGSFECRWVHLSVEPRSKAECLKQIQEPVFCPVAHGEGNFQVSDDKALMQLEQENLIVFRYVDASGDRAQGRYPANPNGSVADIAGICNPAGNVIGLMPHPEDHLESIQNPLRSTGQYGLSVFRAMIAWASN